MEIEKVFDSLNHNFLIFALEKYGFFKEFYLLGKDFAKKLGVLCSTWWYKYKVFSTWERCPPR